MDDLAWKVLARHLTAERVGDPKELLVEFERAVRALENQIPEDKILEAKRVLEERVKSGIPGYNAEMLSYDSLAFKALSGVQIGHRVVSRPGHKLFLSILQTYALPPALRKKIEIASRLYLKNTKPRTKARSGAEVYLERIELWEKYRALLNSHIEYAKAAIAQGKEHSEEGEGATKMKVGPFTLVNTGGFNGKQMDEVADVVQKVTAYAQSAGFGDVCYGEVQITNTIDKANILAFYLLAKDEMFIRANVKATTDVVRTVLHELGHRYQHKFMHGKDRDVERLYHILSGQEVKRKFDTTKVKMPEPGEKLEAKGKTYIVTRTLPDFRAGYKVHLQIEGEPNAKATIPLDSWLALKGGGTRDVDGDPEYIGFITDYAKRGGPGENFAEMFSFYCMKRLPPLQKTPFEELVFGRVKTAREQQADRVLLRYLWSHPA